MNVRLGAALLILGVAFLATGVQAEDLKSGPTTKAAGPFDVRAITGEHREGDKKKELCYFCQFSAQAKRSRGSLQQIDWCAGVYQRGHEHVAADPGKAFQVADAHALSHPRLPF